MILEGINYKQLESDIPRIKFSRAKFCQSTLHFFTNLVSTKEYPGIKIQEPPKAEGILCKCNKNERLSIARQSPKEETLHGF